MANHFHTHMHALTKLAEVDTRNWAVCWSFQVNGRTTEVGVSKLRYILRKQGFHGRLTSAKPLKYGGNIGIHAVVEFIDLEAVYAVFATLGMAMQFGPRWEVSNPHVDSAGELEWEGSMGYYLKYKEIHAASFELMSRDKALAEGLLPVERSD